MNVRSWTFIVPLLAVLTLAVAWGQDAGAVLVTVVAVLLAGAVLAAVHHAEVVAHRVGEPFGSLVLAVAVTVIEVALIVTLMASGGPEVSSLARDTVFAAVMITTTGIVGLSLFVGGRRYGVIRFNLLGVVNVTKAALPVLREQGGGHIIQVSSVGGRVTTPGMSAYQAAKFAVGGFSEVLAQEVAPLGIKVTVLEPGGMRTDWAGSSMTIHPTSPAYEPTVGAVVGMLGSAIVSNAAGDPAKVADVVLTVADLDEPPVRLLLGSDAVRYAAAVEQARMDSDSRWRELSVSTDHADATAADLDPLNR